MQGSMANIVGERKGKQIINYNTKKETQTTIRGYRKNTQPVQASSVASMYGNWEEDKNVSINI